MIRDVTPAGQRLHQMAAEAVTCLESTPTQGKAETP